MSHHHITHSPRTIGHGNAQMLNLLTDAYRAAMDLSDQGYQLLGVRVGDRNPVVRIKGSRHCRHLHGAVKTICGSGAGQRTTTMVTTHRGAQIEWEEQQ
ncbi:MAG: hypothetical protein M3H12_02620 [Chromatiales bacterium]|nr:hypothetical protein [Gammaproteobacteria bacterium]